MKIEEFYRKVGKEWQCPRCAYSTMHESRAVNHARLHGVKIGEQAAAEVMEMAVETAPEEAEQAVAEVMEMAVETAPEEAEQAVLASVKGKNKKL